MGTVISYKEGIYVCNLYHKGFLNCSRHVYRHDVTKVGDFYNGGLWGKSLSFVGSSWKVPGYIKNVDTHPESFS